ncbi:MAG TPA: CHRD domain-containing protein [Actinomycetota bacterium]|nr:CHRD domain-containing protein [Actinomycetota bacterium]
MKKLILATLVAAAAAILVASVAPGRYGAGNYIQSAVDGGSAAPRPAAGAAPASSAGAASSGAAMAPLQPSRAAPAPQQNAAIAKTAPTYTSGTGQGGYGGGSGGTGSGGSSRPGGKGDARSRAAGDGWTTLAATLTGAAERPGPGAPGASGQVTVRLKGTQVCFQESWQGIEATASHIHRGDRNAAGPVVVPFFKSSTPVSVQSATGCVTAAAALVRDISQHPGSFYVNVHTVELPAGALRGQLAMAAGPGGLAMTGTRSQATLVAGLAVAAAGLLLVVSARGRPGRRVAVAGRHAARNR